MDESDEKRISGRKWAEECIDHAISEGRDFLEGFRRQLKRVFAGDLKTPYEMTDKEAQAFERTRIGFGVHAKKTWGEVPITYILWLVEQGRPLREYAASEVFARRQDEDEKEITA